MSNAEYLPGPYEVWATPAKDRASIYGKIDEEWNEVAQMEVVGSALMPTARILSAAPDMFEALQWLESNPGDMVTFCEMATRALDKARGNS